MKSLHLLGIPCPQLMTQEELACIPFVISSSFKNLVDTHMGTQVSGLSSTSFLYMSAHGCPLSPGPYTLYALHILESWGDALEKG